MVGLNRHSAAIFAAVALPLIFLIGFQLFQLVDGQRQQVERSTKEQAQHLIEIVDSGLRADFKLAAALATAASIDADDMPAAYRRAQEFSRLSGQWETVVLSDPAAGTELFDLRRPFSPDARPISQEASEAAKRNRGGATLGGIQPTGRGGYWMPLHMPVLRDGKLRYLITIGIDPDAIQRQATPYFSPDGVGAVVDRDGRFIARSIDYSNRVGRPGTTYLQGAARRGGSGFYSGVTLEGFANYTAYATSPLSGWSAHLAVGSGLIDGPRRWAIFIWAAVGVLSLGVSGLLVWIALRDIARQRRDEERLRQSQKLEAVGQLTGGIAHDFNNLLTAIIGSLDLVLKRTRPGDPNRRHLDGALEAAMRGAKLTSRLLAFSRTQRLDNVRVDVRAVIDNMTDLLQQSLGPLVRLSVHVDERARWVITDPNQLELALLNISLNARDAMPGGGGLTFSTRRIERCLGKRVVDSVEISVADTGVGMSRQVVERAFEPFFTTKEAHKGTGLGLAQVFALARQSEGEVTIDSEIGRGTTIRLILPAAEPGDAGAPDSAASDDEADSPGAGQRILVLDDDDAVRGVLVDQLRARGYEVFQASSGEEALAALADLHPDLFVLDFLMPGMNGAEVARRARQLRPTQRMLIVSGHLDHAALAAGPVEVPILRKPFDGDQLAARVGEILAAG